MTGFDPKGRTGELPPGLSGRDLAWHITGSDDHEDGSTPTGRTRRRVWPEDRVLPVVQPWHRRAECAKPEHDGADFFVRGSVQRRRLIGRTCRRCPVANSCLLEAIVMERDDPASVAGIRGGLTAEQRRDLIATLPESGLVYYGRKGRFIKIGTTTDLPTRAIVLGIEVLATEPGGYRREAELHREFDHLRVTPRGEWFHPGTDLLVRIESLASEFATTAA